MYKTFVRPHLDYCDVIYHEPLKISDEKQDISLTAPVEEVERVQYKGVLAVTGAWQGSNRSNLYDELGWERLTYRRLSHRLIMLFKIVNKPRRCRGTPAIVNRVTRSDIYIWERSSRRLEIPSQTVQ